MTQEFEEWYLNHAKAPIDPWHKEFARAVWKASRESLKQKLLSDEMVKVAKQAIGNALIPDGVWNIDEGFKLERVAKVALQVVVEAI